MLCRLWGSAFDRSGKTLAEISSLEREAANAVLARARAVAPHMSLQDVSGATVVVEVPDAEVDALEREGLITATRRRNVQ